MSATRTRAMDAATGACAALGVPLSADGRCALPRSEDALVALVGRMHDDVRGDVRARPRLAPTGFGSQVAWCRPAQAGGAEDTLFVSTRPIVEATGGTGIVEYVPGDGTLTALAGASLADLRAAVAEGGHRITPALATYSTIGGALAAGRSGPDRCAFGPSRHHVLGARFVDGTGRSLRSGGRLVKNVTGFDLHRLHVGARGTLGVLLEVSLRLVPAPEAEVYVATPRESTLAEAVERALAIRADRSVTPRMLFVADRAVHVVLGGRAAQVDAERAALDGLCDAADERTGGDVELAALRAAARTPALRILTAPSRVAEVARAIESTLGATDGVVVEPDAAIVDVPASLVDARTGAWTDALLPALDALGAKVERRGRRDAALEGAIAARLAPRGAELVWTRRLVDAFDPARLFRIDGFPAGV